jgi:glycogen synthase
MKVLMTTDTVGGVWNFCMQLCRALDGFGVEVTLATMGAPLSAAQRAEAHALRNTALRTSTFRLEWMRDPWDDVSRAGDWLLGLAGAIEPDVVHLNGYAHAALPWPAPVLVTGHSCVLSWWRATRRCDAPAEWAAYRAAVARGLHAADMVATPTHDMLSALRAHYGALPDAIVIPNGVDDTGTGSVPAGRSTAPAVPHTAQAAVGQPLVLAAGRAWDEAKNLATLAAAAPALRWPVCVAGADTDPYGVRRPLPGVRRLGVLSPAQLARWYARAGILVHPSVYEPFGLVPLEAALQRCALVLGDIPSLREVWGDAAVFVDPRDAGALKAAVNQLIGRPDRLQTLAAAAHARATTLSARRMADAYHTEYRRITQAYRSPAGAAPCARREGELCAS